MTYCYFALGTSLATLKNVETYFDGPPHVLAEGSDHRIPLLGPNRTKTMDKALSRSGDITMPLQWDGFLFADFNVFVPAIWGNWTTSFAAAYASWMDESGHYSPFSVTLERPVSGEHYRNVNGIIGQKLVIPADAWTLQSVSKSTNYTVTTSDRLIYVDTSGGSVTLALPAAATPNTYTIFSAVKTSASNSLIVDPNGAELIDGASTKTVTAINARLDFYSDGSAWHTI